MAGLRYHDEAAFESGQFLIDKGKCWRELSLTVHYCEHPDYYWRWGGHHDAARTFYGDKDMFHVAWRKLGTDYAMWRAVPLWVHAAFVHVGSDGKPLFVHRCRDKFRGGGDVFPKTTQNLPTVTYWPALPGEDAAFRCLADLRQSEGAARPPWPVALCVPTLNGYGRIKQLIASARAGTLPPDRIVVIDNGGGLGELEGVEVVRPGRNLGVAASWNWFLRNVPDGVIICNDDVILAPDSLEELCRAAEAHPKGLLFCTADPSLALHRWSLFLQRGESAAKIGMYDEQFWPAYYEDADYDRRIQLARLGPTLVHGLTFRHDPGRTTAALDPATRLNYQDHYAHNAEYYQRKWGGPRHAETYTAPFGGAASWELIPGAFDFEALYRAAVRDAGDGARIGELGNYFGRSLVFLASEVKKSGKRIRVYGIDHGVGDANGQTFRAEAMAHGGTFAGRLALNVRAAEVHDFTFLLTMPSVEAAEIFPDGFFDFFFIDASHDAASIRSDLAAWWPKVRPGGVLAGHDYVSPEWPSVRAEVNAFFGREALGSSESPSCWLARRPTPADRAV